MSIRQGTRRFRRYLPIPLVLIAALWLRPQMLGTILEIDDLADYVGYGIAVIGQAWRLWAWGSNFRNQTSLRTRGPYELGRHPLYSGNTLIAFGLLTVFNNVFAYALIIPLFLWMYSIVTREEETGLLAGPHAAEYAAYMQRVPSRLIPSLGKLRAALATTRPFDWRLAFEKEYESMLGWIAAAVLLEIYEEYFWELPDRSATATFGGVILLFLGLSATLLYVTKKQRTRW